MSGEKSRFISSEEMRGHRGYKQKDLTVDGGVQNKLRFLSNVSEPDVL